MFAVHVHLRVMYMLPSAFGIAEATPLAEREGGRPSIREPSIIWLLTHFLCERREIRVFTTFLGEGPGLTHLRTDV